MKKILSALLCISFLVVGCTTDEDDIDYSDPSNIKKETTYFSEEIPLLTFYEDSNDEDEAEFAKIISADNVVKITYYQDEEGTREITDPEWIAKIVPCLDKITVVGEYTGSIASSDAMSDYTFYGEDGQKLSLTYEMSLLLFNGGRYETSGKSSLAMTVSSALDAQQNVNDTDDDVDTDSEVESENN